MLEFKRRELKFTLDGEEYLLKYPTVKQTREYSNRFKKSKDDFKCVIDFLDTLGLKKDISENMEMQHLNQIIEAMLTEKK